MQIKIEFCEELAEPEITIKCREKTALIDRLVAALQMIDRQIMVSCEGNMLPLALGEILYIESVDGKTFLYTQGKIYESPCKLYELEERLEAYMFVRTSKSAIVNLEHIKSIKTWLDRRLLITMENGESLIASRQYARGIKKLLGV